MYALFLILNDIDKLDKIQEIFYENRCGATSVDSQGLGKILLEHHIDVSVFAGIRKLVEGNTPYNKTIMSVIQKEEKLRKIIDLINEELELDSKKGIGFLFVLPVIECHGYIHDKGKKE
ncbi:hypothetical protein CLTEP_16350 [Clostridium tepidiprofundi DSM 19306]|uniref:Nitrogen regulatory protein P-II n=1 Tax=Clostridium tepidiprofundi DSM 19306 TaxID=1121338 RepID=A0A151B3R8_9CLOT|nr:hypothetical protein [Clostridium tepidiprofundi]KYH34402.1 hypothetical protein CLTEP_16350 [Clostridium tepidiprofundi DSM 19306]